MFGSEVETCGWIGALLWESVNCLRDKSLVVREGLLLSEAAPCVLFLSRAPVCPSALYHRLTQHEFVTRSQVDAGVVVLDSLNLPYC